MTPATARQPHTFTLYVTSNTILPGAEPRWYVCTEAPHRWSPDRLDAPWLIVCGSEAEARAYAEGAVHAYRNHPRLRYAIAA